MDEQAEHQSQEIPGRLDPWMGTEAVGGDHTKAVGAQSPYSTWRGAWESQELQNQGAIVL